LLVQEFDDWLQDTLATGDHTPEERKAMFAEWAHAPSGRYSHPREEHLLPAHVALGCGGDVAAVVMYTGSFLGAAISSFRWD
jgi:4,5-DOPA dioxygenase extradiol